MAILSRDRGEMNERKHQQTCEVNPGQCKLQAGLETRRPEEKLEKSTRILGSKERERQRRKGRMAQTMLSCVDSRAKRRVWTELRVKRILMRYEAPA
jgi:hypothetical protein